VIGAVAAGGAAGLGLAVLARGATEELSFAAARTRERVARSALRRRRADLEVLGLVADDLVVRQVLGAIVGAFFLWLLTNSLGVTDQTGGLGTNGYGTSISMGGAFLLEVLLTFSFVLVILLVTDRAANATTAGLGIGVALVVVHLVGIPLTGTSVNPARSLGPALFEGGTALSQLWLFILAPLVGGIIAALVYPLTRSGEVREQIGNPDAA